MSKRFPATPPAPLTGEILSHRHEFERFVLEVVSEQNDAKPGSWAGNDLTICD